MGAEVLRHTRAITGLSEVNEIRVWACILTAFCLVLSIPGYIKDNEIAISVGFATSITASLMVISVTFTLYFENEVKVSPPLPSVSLYGIITASGTVLNILSGPGTLMPNIMVEAGEPAIIGKALVISYCILFVICCFVSYIPYFIFTGSVEPNIFGTLAKYTNSSTAVLVLVNIGIGMVAIHIMIAIVIFLNPTFQHIEQLFGIPVGKFSVVINRIPYPNI